MKVQVDASEMLKSLEEAKAKIKARLETMVSNVVYRALAEPAIDITPYGDLEKYYSLYEYRSNKYGFPMSAGMAKGGWLITMSNGNSIPKLGRFGSSSRYTDTESGSLSKSRVQAQLDDFKLGSTINLSNMTPYVYSNFNGMSLESGASDQAPQGIKQPTIDNFMSLYKSVMQQSLSKE